MKKAVVGILAHVDAGKTTLSEALLFRSGEIRTLGRVDHADAFLDTDDMEKARGITIFSKQAIVKYGDFTMTLLDTPGHVDFSAETERALRILDYAILVVSAVDGVQGYTETLWRLLARYEVPTFIFVNKMDAVGADHDQIFAQMKQRFSGGCVEFGADGPLNAEDVEETALQDERTMEEFLETGTLSTAAISSLIANRKLFPCYCGSALKLEGVDAFLEGVCTYVREPEPESGVSAAAAVSEIAGDADATVTADAAVTAHSPRTTDTPTISTAPVAPNTSSATSLAAAPTSPHAPAEFGARVYKISHDKQGSRLTWLKVTSGTLPVKAKVSGTSAQGEEWEEKADQVRLYSGEKFELAPAAEPGSVYALTGLTRTYPGEGLGEERDASKPVLEPVLTYTLLPGEVEVHAALAALRTLEDEDPLLHVRWQERLQEVHLQLMGAVQLEIIEQLMQSRFGLKVSFGPGSILYHETITEPAEGVGHFEPLRHYAEVHLLLEPAPEGSGLEFATACSEDDLDRNWQRLILTHLREREHLGVLTGSPLTDMKITLVAGRGHLKHTEGGDFRQATYRAVRQGLMRLRERGKSRVLEPWYRFRLEVPAQMVGRAMADIQRMSGTFEQPRTAEGAAGDVAVVEGTAPVSEMRDYAMDVTAYTHGQGHLTCVFAGYRPCHDEDAVIAAAAYDPETDLENTPDSVFCAHGAGYTVKWNRVEDFMHVDAGLQLR